MASSWAPVGATEAHLCVLGSFALTIGDRAIPSPPTKKARALLTYLTMSGADVGRERLTELFWPDADPERAREGLRSALWSIRRCIRDAGFDPDLYLHSGRATVRWQVPTQLDARQLVELEQNPDVAVVKSGLRLLKGEFLEGDYDQWAVEERERVGRTYETLLVRVVDHAADPAAARLLLARDPYHERAYAVLIDAEITAGRRVAAATLIERCRTALAEIDTEPTTAFKERFKAIVPPLNESNATARRLPFIGREKELRTLDDALAERRRNAASCHVGLVVVSGEAGVGKTRLINEFRLRLTTPRLRVGVGQCLEFAQRPYGPILDILAQFHRCAAEVQPASSKREQFDSFVQSLQRAASKNTLLAIVEDLQWADSATVELLAYLCGQLESMRMLLIATYRGDELRNDDPTRSAIAKITGAAGVKWVHLLPLAGSHLRTFIDEALAGIDLPSDVRRAVAHTSEGNPFFIEELLKSAVEHENPADAASGDRRLPVTARAAVLERLRPLADQDRRVLAQAAIIGRSFDIDLLRETLDMPLDEVLGILQRAQRSELVEEETPTAYRFRHELTRDAIYGDFLPSQVAPMHRRIAMALEALPQERQSVQSLAYHWSAAGDRAKSARYNELAGDAAASLYAPQDAIVSYERAFEAAEPASHDRARILEKVARRQISIGFNDLALRTFARAAEILQMLGDADAEAAFRVRVAVQAYRLGDSDPTGGLEAMLGRCSDRHEVARTRLHLGIAHIAGLRYCPSETTRHLDLANHAVIANDADLRYSYRAARALVTYIDGDADRFCTEIDGWLEAAREASEPASVALVHYNSGMYLSNLGRHDDAESHFVRAFEVARAQRDRMAEAAAYAMHARALLARGDLEGVRSCVDAVHELRTDSEIVTAHAAAWGTLAGLFLGDNRLIEQWFDALHGRIASAGAFMYAPGYAAILVQRGRLEDARALLRVASSHGERPRGMVMTFLAVAQFGGPDDLCPARTKLEQAADAPVETPERPGLALFDAYVERRDGKPASAAAHARVAAEGFARLKYPLLEAAAREVAGDLERARAIFARLGALGELRRLSS